MVISDHCLNKLQVGEKEAFRIWTETVWSHTAKQLALHQEGNPLPDSPRQQINILKYADPPLSSKESGKALHFILSAPNVLHFFFNKIPDWLTDRPLNKCLNFASVASMHIYSHWGKKAELKITFCTSGGKKARNSGSLINSPSCCRCSVYLWQKPLGQTVSVSSFCFLIFPFPQ